MNDRCTALGLGSEAGFVEEDMPFGDKQGSDNMLAGNENGDDRPSNAEKALAQSEYRSTYGDGDGQVAKDSSKTRCFCATWASKKCI
jgi:hypothetical protein